MTAFRRVHRVPAVRVAVAVVSTIRAALTPPRPDQSHPLLQRTVL